MFNCSQSVTSTDVIFAQFAYRGTDQVPPQSRSCIIKSIRDRDEENTECRIYEMNIYVGTLLCVYKCINVKLNLNFKKLNDNYNVS